MDTAILNSLEPVLVLLVLAVVAAVGSQAVRTSPIVGYLLLGVAITAGGFHPLPAPRRSQRWRTSA